MAQRGKQPPAGTMTSDQLNPRPGGPTPAEREAGEVAAMQARFAEAETKRQARLGNAEAKQKRQESTRRARNVPIEMGAVIADMAMDHIIAENPGTPSFPLAKKAFVHAQHALKERWRSHYLPRWLEPLRAELNPAEVETETETETEIETGEGAGPVGRRRRASAE